MAVCTDRSGAHLYAVPSARFLGVTPQDIVDFGLPLAAPDTFLP